MKHWLQDLFKPESVAVIGASNNPDKMGYGYFNGLVEMGVVDKLYPVNIKGETVLGIKGYSSVVDVPGSVDYVICTIPARSVPRLMEECSIKGIRFVHMFTSGLSETGVEENVALEKEIINIARKGGIRVLGPNCMGIYSPGAGLTFYPGFSPESGEAAFISQSGGLVERMIRIGEVDGVHFSHVVSYGNATDLNETDFLEYFAQDNDSRVIGMYLEGVRDGRKLLLALKEAVKKKPVVILKGGTTKAGSHTAASHTGSLSGVDRIWSSICRQTGVIRVYSMEEMLDILMTLLIFPIPRGPNGALIGEGGGTSVLAADDFNNAGLALPPLPGDIRRQLDRYTPKAGTSVRNPVDSLMLLKNPDSLYDTISSVASYSGIDFIVLHMTLDLPPLLCDDVLLEKAILSLIEASRNCAKPVALVMLTDGTPQRWEATLTLRRKCLEAGIPVFKTIKRATTAIGTLFLNGAYK